MSTSKAYYSRASLRTWSVHVPLRYRTSSTNACFQEKLNEAIMALNKNLQVANCAREGGAFLWANMPLQEINIQNMNVELVAQMFKNYQSNVLFHLEGKEVCSRHCFDSADRT